MWADVERWPSSNAEIEQIELSGPFAAGSRIVTKPAGEDPVELRIAVVERTDAEFLADVPTAEARSLLRRLAGTAR